MAGYISLHRDIQKHWLYEEERVFSRYEAWLDILMRVNHAEGKVMHNGTVETVERGSTIWSMGDMEKHWGWSNRKVKRFLLCLEGDQMAVVKSTTKKTYITVINYGKYQGDVVDKAPPMHQRSTTEAFQKHTNNNVNNDNNDNKEITTTTDDDEKLSLGDVYTKIYGTISMTGVISDHLMKLIKQGYTESFCKEVLLEGAESSDDGKSSLRYIEKISERWIKEKIFTRKEAKEAKQKAFAPKNNGGKVTDFKQRKPNKQEIPIAQTDPNQVVSEEEFKEMMRLAQEIQDKKNPGA